MNNLEEYVIQLEDENKYLKTQLESRCSLTDSERELLKALSIMPDGTMYRTVRDMKTKDLKFDYLSGTWEKLMGVSIEESLSNPMNVFRNIIPSDMKLLFQRIEESLSPLTNFSVEVRYLHPLHKQEFWYQISSYPVLQGEFIFANGFIFDVTARKRAEEKLLIEKERLESLGNNIPESTLFQISRDNQTHQIKLTYVSAKWESITGIPSDIAMANLDTLFAIINSDDLQALVQAIQESSESLKNFSIDLRLSVHGKARWVEVAANPVCYDNYTFFDGLLTDITQRKKIEDDLNNEKNRLQMFGDNLPGSALYQFIRDNRTGQLRFTYVSGTWESVTGVSAEKALTAMSNVLDIIVPNELTLLIKSIEESSRNMTDHIFETKFGDQWLKMIGRPRKEVQHTIWDGIITNITAWKIVQHELEAEKNKLLTLGENIPGGSLFQFIRDSRTKQMRFSYVGNTWESVTGVGIADTLADISKVFSLTPLEDFPDFLKDIDQSAINLSDFKREIMLGDQWMRIISRPRKEGVLIVWDGIIINITETKNREEELKLYREKLEVIVEQRTDELKMANDELNIINEELKSNNEELNAINDELFQKNNELENEVERRLQVVKQLEENEAKLSNALQENRYQLAKLDLLIEASGIGMWDMKKSIDEPINPNISIVWSDEYKKLLGYTPEDEFPNVISSWSERLHPHDRERAVKAFENHILDKTGKTPYHIEYQLLKKNGEYGYFKSYGSTVRDKEGNAIRTVGAVQDITAEKTISEEILRHEAKLIDALAENQYQLTKLDMLVEATNIGIWDMQVVNGDPINPNNILTFSDEYRKLLGYTSINDFPNTFNSWSDKLHPDDKENTLKSFESHLLDISGKTTFCIEYRLQKKDGTYGKFLACSATIRDNDGTALRVAGSIKEITENC
ncbi:MAG: PAS domain-containing protein [Marinilabiliaceae bacterium]|nr:PAS domain-containing protein [Marinilabiliaceae bacterium]